MLNGFFTRHHRDTSEHIMDRYIPRALSSHAFHSARHDAMDLGRHLDDSLLNMNHTSYLEGQDVLTPDRLRDSAAATTRQRQQRHRRALQKDPPEAHSGAIREALDFPQGRVLSFTPNGSTSNAAASPSRSLRTPRSSLSGSSTPTAHSASSYSSNCYALSPATRRDSISSASSSNRRVSMDSISDISTMVARPKRRKATVITRPYRLLLAPHLLDDYYTNVISWSQDTNYLAVGLNNFCFLWDGDSDGMHPEKFNFDGDDIVSVVAFSTGAFFLVGTKTGTISLFSQLELVHLSDYHADDGQSICSIAWVPGTLNRFYAGNYGGHVMYFEISDYGQITLVKRFQSNYQQVCGLAISHDGKEIAVGCNENCCLIWDVTNPRRPQFKHSFEHNAAVKAVTYCPWTKSLLATGGGHRDRTIRFWHTTTGTLLDKIHVNGQVTGLMWSEQKKQIVATFGFSDHDHPIVAEAYSYPGLEKMVQVLPPGNVGESLRALAGCLSPDNSSLLVAANDDTIRFYQLWDPNEKLAVADNNECVFGSELIELHEGITKMTGMDLR